MPEVDRAIDAIMLADLTVRHPWLKHHVGDVAHYIPPAYYDRLLKPYVFGGRDDLELFAEFLRHHPQPLSARILELGCGTCRATNVLLANSCWAELVLSDLSPAMIAHARTSLASETIRLVEADHFDVLERSSGRFHLVYSLWSFSHSVHQHMVNEGEEVLDRLGRAFAKFVTEHMCQDAVFYCIHFDTLSDEQRLLVKHWAKEFPIFAPEQQSPSKRWLDRMLAGPVSELITDLSIEHLKGEPIVYPSLDELLEVCLNFHMETEYNRSRRLPEIVSAIERDADQYRQTDGTYRVAPGCFVYSFRRR